MARRTPSSEAEADAEKALRLVYQVLLPRILKHHVRSELGISRPSMARACVRNHPFFLQMAEEMGEWWERTIRQTELASVSDWRRIEMSHLEDAAADLVTAVRALPAPVRAVAERRASGMSWRRISADLPGRVFFSLAQDWRTALMRLSTEHRDTIRRLT